MNKLFKPRYIVNCQFCNKHPLGQWNEYDLYFCQTGPGDTYNWMAYKRDTQEVNLSIGHSTVSVRYNYKKDNIYLVLSFLGLLINEGNKEILK